MCGGHLTNFQQNQKWPVAGGVPGGEGDCVPAESGSGEAPGGRLAVLPAPSDRELQTAVERRSSSWLLHRQTQRKSVLQLEQPWLPVACAGHSFGEEELEEERLWRPDAGGFLLHIPVRRIYRRQHSAIAQHGGSM